MRLNHLILVAIASIIWVSGCLAADQKIGLPTPSDLKTLQEHRHVVERLLSEYDLRDKYPTAAGKLGTLRALLQAHRFASSQTYELQCMGIVLGDAFVQDMGFHWVMVSDELGRDPALQYRNTSVLIYPLTMLSKRVERREEVDVFDLYNSAASKAQELIDAEAGRAKKR
jgi:hypothetical protein